MGRRGTVGKGLAVAIDGGCGLDLMVAHRILGRLWGGSRISWSFKKKAGLGG